MALGDAFRRLDLGLSVKHDTYRGHPSVTFKIVDSTFGKPIEDDPMDAFGGGPAAVLGVVLQVIATVCQPGMARVLILDEPFAQINGEEYIEDAGKLLRKLCEPEPRGLGFKMLVVTGKDVIADAAHKKYKATNESGTLRITAGA
jgi:hypothetical protein